MILETSSCFNGFCARGLVTVVAGAVVRGEVPGVTGDGDDCANAAPVMRVRAAAAAIEIVRIQYLIVRLTYPGNTRLLDVVPVPHEARLEQRGGSRGY
jgi:hypothetical protein